MVRRTMEVGAVYGRLTAIDPYSHGIRGTFKCSCGTHTVCVRANVVSGQTTSCGCFASEEASRRVSEVVPSLKHGGRSRKLKSDPIERAVSSMYYNCISRTENTSLASYKDYGGKGIRMCEEWRSDYRKFREFVYPLVEDFMESACSLDTHGNLPSIERIDPGKGYSPCNVEIVSVSENIRRRNLTRKKVHDTV